MKKLLISILYMLLQLIATMFAPFYGMCISVSLVVLAAVCLILAPFYGFGLMMDVIKILTTRVRVTY